MADVRYISQRIHLVLSLSLSLSLTHAHAHTHTHTHPSIKPRVSCTSSKVIIFFYLAQQPPVGHGLLFPEDSRSYTTTHHGR